MPIYEFKCKDCDEEFEALVFRSDETVPCPACKGEDIKRLMSACAYTTGGTSDGEGAYSAPSAGSSGCAGCAGTSCSTCH
jgi:putative FmdB family regulatory protein